MWENLEELMVYVQGYGRPTMPYKKNVWIVGIFKEFWLKFLFSL